MNGLFERVMNLSSLDCSKCASISEMYFQNQCIFLSESSQFPTLLHFSAHHGFGNLLTVLLECPGANLALDMKNSNDLSPAEMAQVNGHCKLAKKLFNIKVNQRP